MVPSRSDKWKEVARGYLELKSAGHAVVLDTTVTSEGHFVSVRMHHYLTCRKCAEAKS